MLAVGGIATGGQSVAFVNERSTVVEVIDKLMAEAEEALEGLGSVTGGVEK